ncbi:MAG TPA: substrate-binding domain-containing protein [Candidatus Brocadiia bacterium]|nr:substrate-binding domain-containing protein [Candidatus Brocadiia bacterium]
MKGFAAIAEELEARIRRGEYAPGALIPPIRALAQDYGVAPLTIRRAIKVLSEKGRVTATPGVGTRVANACALDTVAVVSEFTNWQEDATRLFWDIMSGAHAACAAHGLRLESIARDSDPASARWERSGLLIAASQVDDRSARRWIAAAEAAGRPYVAFGVDNGFPNFFTPNAASETRLAVEYLYRIGHRRIALIPRIGASGKPRFGLMDVAAMPGAVLRLYAFRDSSDHAMTKENIRACLKKALAGPEPATAVFVGMDPSVFLALECLREEGLAVPKDISFVGCCREAFSVWSGQRVTRVDNPHRRVAAEAVEALLAMAAGGPPCGRVFIEPEFFEGETCAPLDPSKAGQPALATAQGD